MIRANDIQNSLLHLIGWAPTYNGTEQKISADLTISESGIYFQQIHPLLTLENLECIAPDFKNMEFTYSSVFPYSKGMIVQYDGKYFKAREDSVGKQPNLESDYWAETSIFSEWLERKQKASIQKAITRYCTEKIVAGTHKALCESKTLFDGTGRLADTIKNRNNLVGFEIIPIRAKGVTTKIEKIGLQFTEAGEYTIYLMHSSSEVPVKTLKLTKKNKNSAEWFTIPELYLPYQNDIDSGGSWYLCYLQSELPAGSQAIKKNKDWGKEPCGACSRKEYASWAAWSKYLEVHPFYVNEEALEKNEGPQLWDIAKNIYSYDTNYGLNLEVSVHCDITDFIIEQRMLFQDIIAYQFAIDMLREFAYNPNVRTNRHTLNASRLDILYELDGDSSSMKKSGLIYQLDEAFKALELATSGIDRVCLPCKNNGIKYRTI